jgi:hypothetical protein
MRMHPSGAVRRWSWTGSADDAQVSGGNGEQLPALQLPNPHCESNLHSGPDCAAAAAVIEPVGPTHPIASGSKSAVRRA